MPPESVAPAPRAGWPVAVFGLISLLICLALFWPAAVGRKLFAPLDIPANFFPKYKYLDPAASGVPRNHYVIDLMMGDLSRNWLVYQAWRQGEMPWWDPYTEGGKPLAAEANAINVSDPWKILLFRCLPFELAYNWARIIPFLISGIGAFWLLRHCGFGFLAAGWGALLYQFAGANAIMFSGPTAQAACSYLPFLWLLWDRGLVERRLFWFALSALITALIFLSGNLQSHTYVFLFALAFALGYGWGRRDCWRLLIQGLGGSLALGLCLAAPFLLSQVELFLLSTRKAATLEARFGFLTGLLSASSLFPWALGTFRTLDLSKIAGQYAIGFWPYIGSAALIIACLGAALRCPAGSAIQVRKRTALLLIIGYLVICSTPLLRLFYTRTAWLAALGLVVLFALGWERLMSPELRARRWGWLALTLAVMVGVGVQVGGSLLYPRLQPKIEAFVMKKQGQLATLDEAAALRRFQVANFPNEVTLRNREVLLALLSLLALSGFLLAPPAARRGWWRCGILVLSTAPLLMFLHRYIPQHPVSLWARIRAGGPEQQRVVAALAPGGLRLCELAPGPHDYVFPGALAQLFKVHALHGHSSLIPPSAAQAVHAGARPEPALYDALYESAHRGDERGEFRLRSAGPPARYHWAAPPERRVQIAAETLNTITLEIGPGPAGELIRTDTYYPGWHVAAGTPGVDLIPEPPFSARIRVPAEARRITLKYEPRFWRPGIGIATAAAILLFSSLAVLWRRFPTAPTAKPVTAPEGAGTWQ
jgi:hypothetical protein